MRCIEVFLFPGMRLTDIYQRFLDHPRIVTDSRQVEEGAIFFALRGERFDGNSYAGSALDQGCVCAVVDNPDVVRDERFILVENSLETLQLLASHHRRQLDIPLIAITGSNGKTTTKELAAAVLSSRYLVHATRGNLNNHIGVPLTLLSIKKTAEMGIIEMGANHQGEITRLCEIALPDYGLITNVGKAHLEGFGSLDGVKRAKKELYDHLNEHGGIAFYNGADPALREMMEDFHSGKLAYGDAENSLCRGKIIQSAPGLTLRIEIPGEEPFDVDTALIGRYNLDNILAAVALAVHFRIPGASIRGGISAYQPRNMRSQRVETGKNVLIMDAYNANPTSMQYALEDFFAQPAEARIVILGDMLELGPSGQEAHQQVIEYLRQQDPEGVFLVGPIFAACSLPEGFRVFQDVAALKAWFQQHPLQQKQIFLKGSRRIGLESLREAL